MSQIPHNQYANFYNPDEQPNDEVGSDAKIFNWFIGPRLNL